MNHNLIELISSAIENKRILLFDYAGVPREVEPHILGVSSPGAISVNGFDRFSDNWRTFYIDIIENIAIGETFDEERPGYNRHDPVFADVICRIS